MSTDFLIIGGGPSGLSAALFLAKAKRRMVILHKGTSPHLHSFHWLLPGFSSEKNGGEWLQHLRTQVEGVGVEVLTEEVVEATLGASEKKVTTRSGKNYGASVILLASGCHDRHGFIEGEEKFVGRGVFYNAYQEGLWFEGKNIVVEGKSEQAIRETLYLSQFAGKVWLVVPAMRLEVESKLAEQVQKNQKIETFLSASLKKIEGEEKMEGVVVLSAGEEKKIEAHGVFLYSRQSTPQYEFLKGTVEISEQGAVLVDDTFMTSIPGVFACGDIVAGQPQFPFVSSAQGLVTGMYADRYLANLNP